MVMKEVFMPVVIDPDGKIRERLTRIHKETRVQKQKLAAEVMTAGLDVIERRFAERAVQE